MNTKALRQKILDLAIHGKLVPQDPNDEPASVLLERIRDEKERLIKEGKIKRPKKIKTTSDKPHYENVPFEVPSSWIWSTVNEINMYNSKNVDPAKQKENTFELYSVPIFPTNTPEIIKGEKIGSAKQSVENGDVLLCKINPKINRVWFVKNRTENTMIASSEWIVIRNKFMLTDYLVFCFMSPYFRDLMENNVSGVGGSLTRAQPSMVANYAIPIPPLQEQKRIITEIKHWFELIDVIDQGKECLQGTIKKAKSKILDLAIHGKLVPQVPTDEPASELLKRINPKAEITCDNGHYQKLPEGWCECTLGSLFLFIRNGINIHQDKSKIGYPITRIETISSEFIDRSRMGYAAITEDNYSDYYLQKDDILMSHINSPIHVGKCALCDIKAGEKIIHGMNLLCLRPYPDIEAKFILMVFRSPYFKDEIRPFIKNAVNQASINIRNLSSVHLHLPPVSEQHRIVAKIEEIFAQFDAIEASL